MSTIYTVTCSSGDNKAVLIIEDSINPIPGSDTWTTPDADAWGIQSGAVASWGTPDLNLHGVGATPVATLFGFTKSVKPGDVGTGEKLYPEGTFPSGSFDWICMKKK